MSIAYKIRVLKHATCLSRDGNRKWTVFLFNLSSHSHIYIVKITALRCEIFTLGFPPWLKKVACLRESLSKTGPLRFGSENQFPLNFAHECILVQK